MRVVGVVKAAYTVHRLAVVPNDKIVMFRDAARRSRARRQIIPHDISRAAATRLNLSGMSFKRLRQF